MRLSAWLRANNRTLEWLAKEVGRESSVISKLARGLVRPSNEVAAAIHRLTEGEVTSVDHEEAFLERGSLASVPATSEASAA